MDILEQILSIFSDFFDPKKRTFAGYLILSILIAFGWLIFVKQTSIRSAAAKIFDQRVLFSQSAMADYKIFVINRLITFVISPLLITQLAIASTIYFALHNQFLIRPGEFDHVYKGFVVGLYSLTVFVFDDFTKYMVHRWMHKIHFLWAIHKVHHSAETMTPITVYRVHPLEGILYALRSIFAQGLTMSVFFFLFGNMVDLYTVVGVNILVFMFHVTGSNLRHSHINIRYWPWLERILISPAQHQLHHSVAQKHYDKNYGVALAVWDWMFGSLHLSENEKELKFGLDETDKMVSGSLMSLYLQPFVDMKNIIWRRGRKLYCAITSLFSAIKTRSGHN